MFGRRLPTITNILGRGNLTNKETNKMSRPIFPATAYTGNDPVATEFAKLYRPHSTDHEPGKKAMDLILLNRTPNYNGPVPAGEFLEHCSLGPPVTFEGALVDWGPTDEPIIEELATAAFMMPEILHDDDYEWGELYDATPGIPFHTTQGERNLREQISKVHFPSETEAKNLFRSSGGMTGLYQLPRGEWILVSAEGTDDLELPAEERENEEWTECQELSYFAEYDQSTDQGFFISDNKGRPAFHNAERHEQRCALNSLWNHPELDSKVEYTISPLDGKGFTFEQEVAEKPNILDECGIHGVNCSLVATGDSFAAGICRYGGVFVPKRFQGLIGDKGTFTARLTISTEGAKYPLRAVEITGC